jgi:threonine dehydratase
MSHAVTRADIEAAYALIAPHVRRTPVVEIAPKDLNLPATLPNVTFKLEQLQHTGSFKARGAMNNILSADVPKAGVTAASGGNHGAALAFAARHAGVPCTIFVFDFTPAAKADRIRSYGADVRPVEGGFDALMETTNAFAAETGALMVHAYDAPGTLAGQGTVALEFVEQAEPDTLLVATGGGGLIGGMAAYVENGTRLISVEPEAAPTLFRALDAGHPVPSPAGGIAADSLGPGQIGALMFPIAQDYIDEAVLVPEDAIRDAWMLLWDRLRIVVEPGGAVALAALLSGAYRPEPDENLGVLLCGANTNIVTFPDPTH